MMTRTQRLTRIVPATAMTRDFGGYKRETVQPVRKVDLKENKTVKKLKEAWVAFLKHEMNNGINGSDWCGSGGAGRAYNLTLEITKDVHCTAKDLKLFLVVLSEFADMPEYSHWYFSRRLGIFLSALINNGKDDNYVILIRNIGKEVLNGSSVDDLGWQNTKNITIEGNVGICLGGYMKAGLIVINGNAIDSCGWNMRGGKIIVNGDAEEILGWDMTGGEIEVNGRIKDISAWGGKIYHKGKLVFDKTYGADEK